MARSWFRAFLAAAVLSAGTVCVRAQEEEEVDTGVVLGDVDLAERAEIARNLFRRITPGDGELVQDAGTWPAAWEEFGAAWDGAAVEREFGAWAVPVSVVQVDGATVVRDGTGRELWRGVTDFARPESAGVVLTGALVGEEEWAGYEAVREHVEANVRLEAAPPRGGATNGLRFTSVAVGTNGAVELALAWEQDGEVDIFAYGVPHDPGIRVLTWTNDENVVVTTTNTVWTQTGQNLMGYGNDWEWRGTAVVTNGEGLFADEGIPDYLNVVRFYATAAAVDSDDDGWNDGWERFVLHTDPMVANGGNPNPTGSNADSSNVFWMVTTTNEYAQRYGRPDCSFNAPSQRVATVTVTGVPPTTNSIVRDVQITGFVDDAIKVDDTGVDWRRDIHVFDHRSITNEIADLQSGQFELELWDWPRADYEGPNEARFGDTNGVPFRVEWTWAVPMEFRLEHITTNGAPLVVNPSGTRTNREITCVATVLPTNIPDTDIHWEVSGAGMAFADGTDCGREVHLTASQLGSWVARVAVSNSTLPPARLRGKVLEKKTVPVFLHIVRDDDGQNAAMTVAHFQELLAGANQIFEQAAIEFQLALDVKYTNRTAWLEISTIDNWVEHDSLQAWDCHTGGIEVYCIEQFDDPGQLGLSCTNADETAGLTIVGCATVRTLAHELGHACGLCDIYTDVNEGEVPLYNGVVLNVCAQEDWCREVPDGGYGGLTLHSMIRRLLMHGRDGPALSAAVDIPAGRIFGILANGRRGLACTGLSDMGAREPRHW